MTTEVPRVSVIICTYNRESMLERAVHSVLEQSLGDFEVVVVDDGSASPAKVPFDSLSRVRLVRTEHQGTGGARAIGLKSARGEFIAYCDDDDEWTPDHLEVLLSFLEDHPDVDLVYGDSEWHQGGQCPSLPYSFDYVASDLAETNFIFASDVIHRASAARDAGGFDPSLRAFEDWDLWLRMGHRHVLRHLSTIVGRRYWHDDCVAAGNRWPERERVYDAHRARLKSRDIIPAGRASKLPHSIQRFQAVTWLQQRQLTWHSVGRQEYSFGQVSRELLQALKAQDVKVVRAPTCPQGPGEFEALLERMTDWTGLGFYYDFPGTPSVLRCERIVAYTMWESTCIPRERVVEINRSASLLYVPCRQNMESFQERGVQIEIKVLHHGVNPELFPLLNRPRGEVFTFGTFGDLSPRKGLDVLVRAFQDEFSAKEAVRLLLKSGSRIPDRDITDPRITLTSGFLDGKGLLQILASMDAYVLPSRGEGFGLTGLEAMATGLPTIATNWSGPTEYLSADDSYPLSYRLVEAGGTLANHVEYRGLWAEPDYEHLRFLMRWVYEHREEAAEKGRLASQRVHRDWTWDRVARQFIADLDAVAAK